MQTIEDVALSNGRGRPLPGFAVLDSNKRAHDLAAKFAEGRATFGIIQGPPGWGKTHLLKAAASACSSAGAQVRYLSGMDFARPPRTADRPDVLLVDDLQAAAHPRLRQRLCIEMERRIRAGRPTLCAACPEARPRSGFLPFPRLWLTEAMSEPTPKERETIFKSMCQAQGLHLPDAAIRVACRLVEGDGRALQGAVTRLKMGSHGLGDLSPLRTAGLLNPFLEPGGFDLRDLVVDCVSLSFSRKGARKECRDVASIYIMRECAVLPEEWVATYLGLSPARVFKLQREARCRLEGGDTGFARAVERSVALIDARLVADTSEC